MGKEKQTGGETVEHTDEFNLNLGRQDFVNGVDPLYSVEAVGRGVDVDDGVLEGGCLGEAGVCGWG